MSDTTWDECKCCRHDTDCIEGLCIECREYNYKLQKQVDLLTLGLLEEKRKMGDKPKCKTCNDTGVYEHTIVTGEILPVKCLHGAVKYPNAKPITEHPDVQRLIRQVVELQEEGKLLREEMETRNMASSKALDELWKEIILKKSPGYGDWEYPMQAMRHIVCEFEELQAENVKMKAALKKYGQHTKICEDEKYPEVWHCICGFEQALKGE